MKNATDGFTLLEVLAAVAVLGIWFVVLASVGVQGLRAEGSTERRLRASLLADTVLAEIELSLADGEVSAEDSESERDGFEVLVEWLPLAELEIAGGSPDLNGLLASAQPELSRALWTISVEVRWFEAEDEFSVRRRTYGWDAGLLQETLGAEEESAAGANP